MSVVSSVQSQRDDSRSYFATANSGRFAMAKDHHHHHRQFVEASCACSLWQYTTYTPCDCFAALWSLCVRFLTANLFTEDVLGMTAVNERIYIAVYSRSRPTFLNQEQRIFVCVAFI